MSTGVRKSTASQVVTQAVVFIAIEHWSIKMKKEAEENWRKIFIYIKGLPKEYELKEEKIE